MGRKNCRIGQHAHMHATLHRSCLTLLWLLCPWDSSGKNTWVGCRASSRGSSQPRDQTCISWVSCIGRGSVALVTLEKPIVQNLCCSVAKSCLTLCNPMDCSISGFPVLNYTPEFPQTHALWVDDDIEPSHPLSSPSPPALNLSQHQDLFHWVGCSHQVVKVLELSASASVLQWTFRTDFL